MKKYLIIFLILPVWANAQNAKVQIGDNANEATAILQIDSDNRGVLIPRMTSSQKNGISNPVDGLLVFDNSTNSFWYYKVNQWMEVFSGNSSQNLISDADGDTKIELEQGNTDDDIIRFFAFDSAEQMEMDGSILKINPDEDLIIETNGSNVKAGFEFRNFPKNLLRIGLNTSDAWKDADNGLNSVGIGKDITVAGKSSFWLGASNNGPGKVDGNFATGFGSECIASGNYSVSMGILCASNANASTSWGNSNLADKISATAWGNFTKAKGIASTTWGYLTEANADVSTAFGSKSKANGVNSVAWGLETIAHDQSFAWGNRSEAFSNNEIVCGTYNKPYTPNGTGTDKLFVVGNGSNVVSKSNAFEILKNNSTQFGASLKLYGENNSDVVLGLKEETNGTLYGFEFDYDAGNNDLYLRSRNFSGNDAIRMTWTNQGNVGLGRIPITNKLEINGTASKSLSGPWESNSDRRLKKNIQNMDSQNILQKVLAMRPVYYEWNDTITKYNRPEGIQTGFIAQELEQIWPNKVQADKLGYLQTAYGDYDPIFVGAFKATQNKIENLKSQNSDLQSELENIKNNNDEFKSHIEELEQLIDNAKLKLAKI